MDDEALDVRGVTDPVEIGRGGFGVVYRANETDLDRPVAVKILTGELDECSRNRFDRERRAMGALSGHPNIATVHRSGFTESGRPYLVMEFLSGGSLSDRLTQDGPMGWQRTLEIGVELGGALETAHREGVLHRDIKPGNILLSGLGMPKLGDFGIARLQGAPETRSAVVTASLAHAAPEVVAGQRPDGRADIYALASTLYELLSGTAAFSRPTDESLVPMLARIAQEPAPDLRSRGVPDPVCRALDLGMAKDPAQRPATAAAFGRELQAAQRALGVAETPMRIEGEQQTEAGDAQPAAPPGGIPVPVVAPPPPPSGAAGPTTSIGGPGAVSTPPQQASHPPTAATGAMAGASTGQPHAFAGGTAYAGSEAPPGSTTGGHAATGHASPPPAGGRKNKTGLIVAGIVGLVAVVAIGAAVAAALIGNGDTTSPPTTLPPATSTPVTTPSTTTPPTTPPTTQPPTPTTRPPIVPAGDYDSYTAVTDATGALTVELPTEWADATIDANSILAATDLDGAFGANAYTASGIAFLLFDTLGGEFDSDLVLNEFEEPGCTNRTRDEYDDGRFVGRIDSWTGCGPLGNAEVLRIAAATEDPNFFVVVSIQATEGRDAAAFIRIRDTFNVDDSLVTL